MTNKNINELVATLLKASSQEEMLDLLRGLLTIGELDEVARRLEIVKLLKAGVSQRDISERLKVGVATVTRGSKEIKQGRFKNV